MNHVKKIWNDHQEDVSRFLRSKSADFDLINDIKSSVFEKLINRYNKIQDKSKIKSWLLTAAKNELLDNYKLNQKKTDVIPELQFKENVESPLVELSYCATHLINSLPKDYKNAILLTDIQGISQKDAAKTMEISYSGLKSRVQRARKLLLKNLNDCCEIRTNTNGQIIDFHQGGQSSEECCQKCFSQN